jgi:hypothetical protein
MKCEAHLMSQNVKHERFQLDGTSGTSLGSDS